MTYFIVEAPYEKGFDYFFKNEYGYPNFYRITELLPTEQRYSQYILLAPNQTNPEELMDKISQQAQTQGFRYCAFGADLSTTFKFNDEGHLCTSKHFKTCLLTAMAHFASTSLVSTHQHKTAYCPQTPTPAPNTGGGSLPSTTASSLASSPGTGRAPAAG